MHTRTLTHSVGPKLNELLVGALVLLSLACGQTASASTVYTYTGGAFQQVTGPLTATEFVTASITLPQILPANLVNANLAPIFNNPNIPGVSWIVSDGVDDLSSANSANPQEPNNPWDGIILDGLYTDFSGAITQWQLYSYRYAPTLRSNSVTISSEGLICGTLCFEKSDSAFEYSPVYYLGYVIAAQQTGSGASLTAGGSPWTMTAGTQTFVLPEPSTLALLLLPIVAISHRRARRLFRENWNGGSSRSSAPLVLGERPQLTKMRTD